jgi:hypothetical protein
VKNSHKCQNPFLKSKWSKVKIIFDTLFAQKGLFNRESIKNPDGQNALKHA